MSEKIDMLFTELRDMRRELKDDFGDIMEQLSKKISWAQFFWIIGGITTCGILVASFLWGAIKEANEKIASSEEKIRHEIFTIKPR